MPVIWSLLAAAALVLALAIFASMIDRAAPGAYAVTPVEGARMIALGGGEVRYQRRGDAAPTLVFLHGFNGELANWDPVFRELERNGCTATLLRLDIPGFGGSDWPSSDYGLPAQAKRVVELMDSLGIGAASFVGTSMGGSLAAWIAGEYPERVERLLLLAPSGHPDALTYSGLFGALVRPGLLNRVATLVVNNPLYRRAFPGSRALQALTVTATYGAPWLNGLGRIRAPTVIAWSRSDRTVPVEAAEPVAAAIPGSKLVFVSDSAGHGIPGAEPGFVATTACRLASGATD